MSDFVKSFNKKYKPTVDKYKKFIDENDWSIERSKAERESGWKIEEGLVKSILNRLVYFIKKAEGDMHLKITQTTITNLKDVIDAHLERVDDYVQREDITEYKDKHRVKEEIDFQDSLFSSATKIYDTLSTLPIDNTFTDSLVTFYDKQHATLPLRNVVESAFFKVKNKVESLSVDWNVSTSKELFINMDPKDIPPYNPNKHYWEQDESTIQFWNEELTKMTKGVNINGYHFHPWLYFHGNFFKARVPVSAEIGDKVMSPFIRDNEWFFIENYEEAKIKKKILAITGSRRFAKTTTIASQTHWKALTLPHSENLVAGGSAKDLGQVEKNLKLSFNNIEAAFRVPMIKKDWSDKAVLGVKSMMHTPYEQSKIHIINLNKGGNLNSELLAGYTPDSFILDEYLKFSFLDALEGAKPAFQTPYGWRCVPILTGTGGNEDLSQDALKMLSDPGAYDVLVMNWDRLNNMVTDPKEVTWQMNKFGTFVPAQMSVKDGIVKKDSNMAEYLKLDNKDLAKVKMQITDWEQANKVIREDRKKKEGQPDAIRKEKIYYPIDTDEIFLSGKTNPYPAVEAKKRKDAIIAAGDVGKRVTLHRNSEGKVYYELSDKEYPLFPFPGGFHDSPVTIFEEPPENPDTTSMLYIAGLDDYKHESSDGDSLGSFVIHKRTYQMGEWDDRIVASYHARPDPHSEFHRIGLMLLELYGAVCFMENEDMDFKTYLDKKYLTDKYLLKGVNFLSEFGMNVNKNREFGWQPTTKNKRNLLGQSITYTKEEMEIKDEDGNIVSSVLGVNRINDVKILDEIINFKEGGNYDGITAWMSALGYVHYLDSTYQTPRIARRPEDISKPKPLPRAPFGRTKYRKGGAF
jgi:hypothetical protein